MVVPNAPTVTAPEADLAANLATDGVSFGWTHNDPDGDPQAGWAIKRQRATVPTQGGAGVSYGTEEWWSETDQAVLGPVKTITTSTASTSSAYSNQRKIDRCQNGVLWAVFHENAGTAGADATKLRYSTDGGATWNDGGSVAHAGSSANHSPSPASFFIDLDDYAHIVYKDQQNGYIYYRRGTPNAGRTAWTWSAATLVIGNAGQDTPDVVAHREGTGWAVHIVTSIASSETISTARAFYTRLTVTSAGAVSVAASNTELVSSNVAGGGVNSRVSIDFHHTGDGKTVAGGTPHLYVGSTDHSNNSNLNGVRFRKAVYSGGVWTWNTGRLIDITRYTASGSDDQWLTCLFDGTRVVLVGLLWDGSNRDLIIYERDAADTATTTTELLANVASASMLQYGSATYDGSGNLYLFGLNQDEASGSRDLIYRKWTRSGSSLGSEVVIDTAAADTPYVSAKRGYSGGLIEFIYTDGTASPYNVNYDSIVLAEANSWVPAEVSNTGAATSKTITTGWAAGDATYRYAIATADAGGLGAYTDWRWLNPWEWWDGSAWQTMVESFVTGAVSDVAIPGTDFEGKAYQWTVATKDAYTAAGPYATPFLFTFTQFERWGAVFI